MRLSHPFAWALVAVPVASLIFAVIQFQRSQDLRVALSGLEAKRKEIAAKAETFSKNAGLEVPNEELPKEAKPPKQGAESQDAPQVSTANPREELRMDSLIAEARQIYGPFFHRRGLTPEYTAIAAARIVAYDEAYAGLIRSFPREHADDPSHPKVIAIKAGREREMALLREDMNKLLGPGGYEGYEQYKREIPHWTQVREVALHLYDTDAPLTPRQAEQLGEIMIAHATDSNGVLRRLVLDWEGVIADAAGMLSPPQLEVLQTSRAHQLSIQALTRAGRPSAPGTP